MPVTHSLACTLAITQVWHEYIANRHHLHMNATIWETLTNFIKYLGKTGKAVVDNTPKALRAVPTSASGGILAHCTKRSEPSDCTHCVAQALRLCSRWMRCAAAWHHATAALCQVGPAAPRLSVLQGWFITYIDQSPEAIRRAEERAKKAMRRSRFCARPVRDG